MWGDTFFRSLGTCALGFFFYCSVSLFAFVVGLVGGAGVSAVGTTLLQSPTKGQVKLVLLWGFAGCGNRKALRLKAQGVYSCK